MKQHSFPKRLVSVIATCLATALVLLGLSAPAQASATTQTGTLIAPVTVPEGIHIGAVNDDRIDARVYKRVEDVNGWSRLDWVYDIDDSFDPQLLAFVFTNVPLGNDYVVTFDGYWAEDEFPGGESLETTAAHNITAAGQTETFPAYVIEPLAGATVKVPVVLPNGLDPADIDEDTFYPEIYQRALVNGEYSRVYLDDDHNYYDEAYFHAADSAFYFYGVPLVDNVVARLRGDLIERTWVGGDNLATAASLNLTTQGQVAVFPPQSVTRVEFGTVYAPVTLPQGVSDPDTFSAELAVLVWDAAQGKYVPDGWAGQGLFDSENSRFVFRNIELASNLAVNFYGSGITESWAGGNSPENAQRMDLVTDGQIITFGTTALTKQSYGTVSVPVTLPTDVTQADIDSWKFYPSIYRRIWVEDANFLDGGYYDTRSVDYENSGFNPQNNTFVFTGVKSVDDLVIKFDGSKAPKWYSGGRSLALAETRSLTDDGQNVLFSHSDFRNINPAAPITATFGVTFPKHIGLAYVRWDAYDANGMILASEDTDYDGTWDPADWDFTLELDPSITTPFTVGVSTESNGTIFPTADGGKTRNIAEAQFLTPQSATPMQFNQVDVVHPDDLARGLLKVSGSATPGKTVTLDHSAYPWQRIYGETWHTRHTIVWEAADSENGPWTEVGSGVSFTVPSHFQSPFLRVSVLDLWELGNQSALTSVSGLTLTTKAKPTISGAAAVNSKLTAKAPQWSSKPNEVTYQWLVNGSAVSGATKADFTVPASALGKTVSVKVTATKVGLKSVTATSANTAKVAAAAFKTTKNVSVSGTARVASKLTAKAATWSEPGVTVKYQWLVNGAAVKGATKTTFTVPSSAAGKYITVRATASKAGYATISSTSSRTKKVAKSTATVSGKLAKTSIKKKKSTSITVTVKIPGVSRPTGTITVKVGSKSVKAKIKSSHKGKIKVTLKGSTLKTAKRQKVTVSFTPSGSTAKAVNKSKTTKMSKTLTVAK